MVDVETLIDRFPEFEGVDAPFLQRYIDAATAEVDPKIWGAKADEGILYLAAHKLALSPAGKAARLQERDKSTTYEKEFRRLVRIVSSGYRVVA